MNRQKLALVFLNGDIQQRGTHSVMETATLIWASIWTYKQFVEYNCEDKNENICGKHIHKDLRKLIA